MALTIVAAFLVTTMTLSWAYEIIGKQGLFHDHYLSTWNMRHDATAWAWTLALLCPAALRLTSGALRLWCYGPPDTTYVVEGLCRIAQELPFPFEIHEVHGE